MTRKEFKEAEKREKAALRKHKASRAKITKEVVKKNEQCEDICNVPKVITTDIGGKLLFSSIFAGYLQDTNGKRTLEKRKGL